jgi:type IV secretory pathway TrbD component
VKTEELKTPIHESLNRPILLLGGERNLVLMLAVIAGVFILSLAKLWAALAGLVLWTVGQWTLSRAASYDALPRRLGPDRYAIGAFTPRRQLPSAGCEISSNALTPRVSIERVWSPRPSSVGGLSG